MSAMFNNLSKREKMVIVGALVVLITAFTYFQILEPIIVERRVLAEQTEGLRAQYQQTMQLIQRKMPETKKAADELEAQYAALIREFPHQKEISVYLLEIERMAQAEGIKLEYFSPKNLQDKGEFFALPIHISFFANYPAMGKFIYALENSARRMDVTTLDVKTQPGGEGRLQVNLTVNIYIVKEQRV